MQDLNHRGAEGTEKTRIVEKKAGQVEKRAQIY
jgi:hypothetical protein